MAAEPTIYHTYTKVDGVITISPRTEPLKPGSPEYEAQKDLRAEHQEAITERIGLPNDKADYAELLALKGASALFSAFGSSATPATVDNSILTEDPSIIMARISRLQDPREVMLALDALPADKKIPKELKSMLGQAGADPDFRKALHDALKNDQFRAYLLSDEGSAAFSRQLASLTTGAASSVELDPAARNKIITAAGTDILTRIGANEFNGDNGQFNGAALAPVITSSAYAAAVPVLINNLRGPNGELTPAVDAILGDKALQAAMITAMQDPTVAPGLTTLFTGSDGKIDPEMAKTINAAFTDPEIRRTLTDVLTKVGTPPGSPVAPDYNFTHVSSMVTALQKGDLASFRSQLEKMDITPPDLTSVVAAALPSIFKDVIAQADDAAREKAIEAGVPNQLIGSVQDQEVRTLIGHIEGDTALTTAISKAIGQDPTVAAGLNKLLTGDGAGAANTTTLNAVFANKDMRTIITSALEKVAASPDHDFSNIERIMDAAADGKFATVKAELEKMGVSTEQLPSAMKGVLDTQLQELAKTNPELKSVIDNIRGDDALMTSLVNASLKDDTLGAGLLDMVKGEGSMGMNASSLNLVFGTEMGRSFVTQMLNHIGTEYTDLSGEKQIFNFADIKGMVEKASAWDFSGLVKDANQFGLEIPSALGIAGSAEGIIKSIGELLQNPSMSGFLKMIGQFLSAIVGAFAGVDAQLGVQNFFQKLSGEGDRTVVAGDAKNALSRVAADDPVDTRRTHHAGLDKDLATRHTSMMPT